MSLKNKSSVDIQSTTEKLSVKDQASFLGVSSWEYESMLRLMGWTEDKVISSSEFNKGLSRLKGVTVGG